MILLASFSSSPVSSPLLAFYSTRNLRPRTKVFRQLFSTVLAWTIWWFQLDLRGEPYPSKKYDESQVGWWWFPIQMEKYKPCSSHHQPVIYAYGTIGPWWNLNDDFSLFLSYGSYPAIKSLVRSGYSHTHTLHKFWPVPIQSTLCWNGFVAGRLRIEDPFIPFIPFHHISSISWWSSFKWTCHVHD